MAAGTQTKATERRRWQRTLWLAAVGLGLACAGITWVVQAWLFHIGFYPLLSTQGVVYDRGMTEYALHRSRGGQPVAVVELKETTRQILSRRPAFPPFKGRELGFRRDTRAFHTRLTRKLKELGARVIVFDMLFDEDEPEFDTEFARAIREHGNVVLAAVNDTGQEMDGMVERTTSIQPPNATLRTAARAYGTANVEEDVDRTLRRFGWWSRGIDEDTVEYVLIPSLSVAAAALYHGKDPRQVLTGEVVPYNTFLGKPIVGFGDRNSDYYVSYIRYFGARGSPAGLRSMVSYEDVFLAGEDPNVDVAALRQKLAGKIVFVGETAKAGQDIHRSPVLTPGVELGGDPNMPGVEVQAHIAQTVLSGAYPRDAGTDARTFLVLAACLVMAMIARVFNPAPAVVLGVVGIFALTYGSIWFFADRGVWLEPVTAVAGLTLTTLAGSTLMYFLEHRERMVVRRQLARHVGEGVASQLDEGEWPERGGEAVEITVMFSDLQGFTTLSESLSSPEMCALLNRYFGDILFAQVDRFGGSTDKLMGDGMMAYFGWPVRHKDHAARAVQCALEIERELVKWLALPENAALPPLRTRIGLHSGVATVGEIGSGKRVEFTVIGDVVNTSARLEGMNKDYGSVILMTEPTYAAAGSFGVKVEHRGPVPVRGKGLLVDVYSIHLEDITGPVPQDDTAETTGRLPEPQTTGR